MKKYHKICKCCGKPFDTNSPQKLFCDRPHYLPCPVCGKLVLKPDRDFTKPPKCCSTKCTHELRKRKFKPKICAYCGEWFIPNSGVAKICNKTHYKNCEICGNQFIRTPATDGDGITTCSPECTKEKLKRNSLKKYGTAHPMQNKEVQARFHASMKSKYGVEHALQIPGKIKQQQKAAYITNLKHWGVPYACLTEQCIQSQGRIVSNINIEFTKHLKAYGIPYSLETRIEDKSYDIHLPEQNILIEINPTYTHSIIPTHWNTAVTKTYHLEKTQLAEKHGYRCIHVFDWDDWDKVLQLLQPKVPIHARDCTIYKLNAEFAREFTKEHDLQGSCRGQRFCLGLVKDGELYQTMTFGKPRYNKNYSAELLRLCTKSGYRVVGGASRLFKYATENFGLSNIVSYCNYSKFPGTVHEIMGMEFVKLTPPQEVWSKGYKYISANLLRARGYDQLFGTNYGKGVSNEQLMLENGWLPVYDCGQKVFVYR